MHNVTNTKAKFGDFLSMFDHFALFELPSNREVFANSNLTMGSPSLKEIYGLLVFNIRLSVKT